MSFEVTERRSLPIYRQDQSKMPNKSGSYIGISHKH